MDIYYHCIINIAHLFLLSHSRIADNICDINIFLYRHGRTFMFLLSNNINKSMEKWSARAAHALCLALKQISAKSSAAIITASTRLFNDSVLPANKNTIMINGDGPAASTRSRVRRRKPAPIINISTCTECSWAFIGSNDNVSNDICDPGTNDAEDGTGIPYLPTWKKPISEAKIRKSKTRGKKARRL